MIGGPRANFCQRTELQSSFSGAPCLYSITKKVVVDICQLCGNACSAKILALTGVQGPNCKGLGLNRELFWAKTVVCRRRRRWRLTMTMIRSLVRSNWGADCLVYCSAMFPSTFSVPPRLQRAGRGGAMQLYRELYEGLVL